MIWEQFNKDIQELSSKIDFTPDIIIGIVRGGIIPARLLSTCLKVKEMYCLTVKKIGKDRKVFSEIKEDLKNRNILLVEDMLETGKSLIEAKKYLESKGVIVKTCCLFIMLISEIEPDYYLKLIDKPINFPWN